jgi:sorbitol-6-phosphate 2-dehydrogenase
MTDSRTRELIIAARMACLRFGVPREPPVVRRADVATGDIALSLDADMDAAGLVAALESHITETSIWPASLGIGDLVLAIHPITDITNARGRASAAVALVTGAAQGFGKGITEALAREGALVTVADLNDEAGQAFVDELNERHGSGTAIFCKANVTDLASMEAAAGDTVDAFGGIDLLVSNAGILKVGGIDEMSEDAFDAVTAVNYKGFFLSVKAVTPYMKLQHSHHADHFMDIVQINSKSGLEGSNRNFAYAGSKFGSIGLVQSFALELVSHHIKVNAICPGNYFDGPLWSDPERGLFVEYLKAGKVAGATHVDDVKAFYTSKVPMNRGCLPEDVVTGLLYLRDQHYETGQALPVTGGQTMLK